MTSEKQRTLTVVVNNSQSKEEYQSDNRYTTTPNENYHTNPMYEKLLNFKELQKKKRFSVEDLLKW